MKINFKLKKTKWIEPSIISLIMIIHIILFLIGTFLDLQIAKLSYKKSDWYGIFFDKFGQIAFLIPVHFILLTLLFWLEQNLQKTNKNFQIIKFNYYLIIIIGTVFYLLGQLYKTKHYTVINVSTTLLNIILFIIIFIIMILYFRQIPLWLQKKENLLEKIILATGILAIFFISTELLKNIFSRSRPFSVIEYGIQYRSWWNISYKLGFAANKSFPSGHVTNAVTIIIPAIFFMQKSLMRYLWIGIGFLAEILVGVSRIILAKHFLTDIVGAGMISFMWMLLFEWIYNRLKLKRGVIHA